MKIRIDGVSGLCDAALVRMGNSSELICRVRVPASYGKWSERFVGKQEFRALCSVQWVGDGEQEHLADAGFVD